MNRGLGYGAMGVGARVQRRGTVVHAVVISDMECMRPQRGVVKTELRAAAMLLGGLRLLFTRIQFTRSSNDGPIACETGFFRVAIPARRGALEPRLVVVS